MPAIKLGSAGTCKLTGKSGVVVRFAGEVPIYKAPDGSLFKRPSSAAGKPCLIRIHGIDGPPLQGVRLTNTKAKVTAPDPIWNGAVVTCHSADIRSAQ